MSGYMQDPARFSDKQLYAWAENFRMQPLTLDYMAEWSWGRDVLAEIAKREQEHATWPTEGEIEERFCRETLPLRIGDPYYHPGGCPNCGDRPCYLLCSNHPFHYSHEDEIRDEFAEEGSI